MLRLRGLGCNSLSTCLCVVRLAHGSRGQGLRARLRLVLASVLCTALTPARAVCRGPSTQAIPPGTIGGIGHDDIKRKTRHDRGNAGARPRTIGISPTPLWNTHADGGELHLHSVRKSVSCVHGRLLALLRIKQWRLLSCAAWRDVSTHSYRKLF